MKRTVLAARTRVNRVTDSTGRQLGNPGSCAVSRSSHYQRSHRAIRHHGCATPPQAHRCQTTSCARCVVINAIPTAPRRQAFNTAWLIGRLRATGRTTRSHAALHRSAECPEQVCFEYQTLPPCSGRRYECAVKVSQQWIGLRQAPLLSVSGRSSRFTERHIWKQR